MKLRMRHAILTAGLCCLASAAAEAASPVINNILPRGAARGSTVELRIVGQRLDDALDLVFHDPGIAFEDVVSTGEKEFRCVVAIDAGCAVGRHAIRVRTATGLSNPFVFSVGTLNEISETEPNGAPATAEAIAINTTVNGVVTDEDVDYFAVELGEGDRLSVEVEAIRLGHTLFDAKLRLFGPGGHELIAADDVPPFGLDAAFVYVAEEAGRHLVAINEATYGGSNAFEYRLHIGNFPRPLAMTPVGGSISDSHEVKWLGDPLLERSSVLPRATDRRRAVMPVVADSGNAPTPLAFHPSELPAAVESEPNNGPGKATPLDLPGALEGIINEQGDTDWFSFEGKKGEQYDVNVIARAVGSPLDSVLGIRKPDGKSLLWNDDNGSPDSSGRITLPEDGIYTGYVRDHLRNGGETFVYRVEFAPVKPSLWFTAVNNPACGVSVAQNNYAFVLLSLNRRNFDAEVRLEFPELPVGVRAYYDPIPAGRTEVPIVFHAASDAETLATLVGVSGTAQLDNGSVKGGLDHTLPLVVDGNRNIYDALYLDRLGLAVTQPTPFSLELIPPATPVPRFGKCDVTVRATRSDGFGAPITVKAPWLPGGIGIPTATIGEGESETTVQLEVSADASLGEAHLVLVGESQGYEIATPFTPITVDDRWLSLDIQMGRAEQGTDYPWPAELTVNTELPENVTIEPFGLPRGIQAAPLQLTTAARDLTVPLTIAADAPEGKLGPIRFRTTVDVNGEAIRLYLGQAQLQVFKPLPPKLVSTQPAEEPPKNEEASNDKPKRRTRFPSTE